MSRSLVTRDKHRVTEKLQPLVVGARGFLGFVHPRFVGQGGFRTAKRRETRNRVCLQEWRREMAVWVDVIGG
jgi:hypothetical protein